MEKLLPARAECRLAEKTGELGQAVTRFLLIFGQRAEADSHNAEAPGEVRLQLQSDVNVGLAVLQTLGELHRARGEQVDVGPLRLQLFDCPKAFLKVDFGLDVAD